MDDEEEDDVEEKVTAPVPPKEVLFTPEELKEREKRRLNKSKCCLKEAWDLFSKLTNPLGVKAQKERGPDGGNGEGQADGVRSDSFLDSAELRRVALLERKFAAFRKTLHLLAEAAHPPFTRISDKLILDLEGRGKRIPEVTKGFHPEVDVDYTHPSTQAAKKLTPNVTNVNFDDWDNLGNLAYAYTQTTPDADEMSTSQNISTTKEKEGGGKRTQEMTEGFHPDVGVDYTHPSTQAHKKLTSSVTGLKFDDRDNLGEKTSADTRAAPDGEETSSSSKNIPTKKGKGENHNLTSEDFEYSDIPLDEDGNPIGKTTGICEFCGKEILPIPTLHERAVAKNPSQLYCCHKYMEACDDAARMERKLQDEIDAKNFLIDIKPHGPYDPTRDTPFPDDLYEQAFGGKMMGRAGAVHDADGKAGAKSKRGKGGVNFGKEDSMKTGEKGRKGVKLDVEGGELDKKGVKGGGKGSGKDSDADERSGKSGQKSKKGDKGTDKKADKDIGKGHQRKGKGRTGKRGDDQDADPSKKAKGGKSLKQVSSEDKAVDTFSLPWDPYETHFHHGRFFNDQVFDDGSIHCYEHPYVVLTQDEMYGQNLTDEEHSVDKRRGV